ncbi:phosphoglycolate phosphatase [Roseivivax sp. CAU 1753]
MSARIVFDLDGTLIDSAPDICAVGNSVLDDEGLPRLTLDEAITCIGSGAAAFVAGMRALRGIPDAEQARLLETFIARYETGNALTELYPGVRAALGSLAAGGHRLGLCTNKPIGPTHAVLRHFDLDQTFGAVIGGDSLDTRKPDPAPLLAALAALGDGPALYVGDSEIDAGTAERAGVPFLLYTEGYCHVPLDTLTQRARFSDFADLPGLVAEVLDGV